MIIYHVVVLKLKHDNSVDCQAQLVGLNALSSSAKNHHHAFTIYTQTS